MIVSWKTVRTSLAMSACLGLLAACQDRGQFKSKKWTPEQIQANLAAKNARDAQKNAAQSNDPATTPVATDPALTDAKPNMPSTKLDPANPGANPAAKPGENQPVNTGSASGIVIQEKMLARDKFIDENNQRMKDIDPMAVKIFKGVSAVFAGSVGDMRLALDLGVQVGEEVRFISVGETPVKFSEKDLKATQLSAMVKDVDGNELVMNEQQLLIFATCKDAVCSELHVRVQIAVDKDSATLAFVMRPVGKVYQIIDSNLKDQMIPFEQFTQALETGKAPANKADKKPAEVPTQLIAGEKPAASPGQETAKGDKDAMKDGAEGNSQVAKDPSKGTAAPAAPAATAAPSPVATKTSPAAEQKSQPVSFKPVAAAPSTLNLPKVEAPAVMDLKPAAKPLPAKDPGTFSFPVQKAPGIFGSTTGLTSATVQAKTSAPAAVTPAQTAPVATVDTSSADAEKENQMLAEVLNQEKQDQAAQQAKPESAAAKP